MSSVGLLNLGNPRKVKIHLEGIVEQSALDRIEEEIQRNVVGLFDLARHHYRFAVKQSSANWRQKVSRLYYAAYNAARAVRLFEKGEYSTDSKDHQKFTHLPKDFPNRSTYENQLPILRDDRNICDYDHLSRASDLALGSKSSTELVRRFMSDVESYLRNKGMSF